MGVYVVNDDINLVIFILDHSVVAVFDAEVVVRNENNTTLVIQNSYRTNN